MFFETTDMKSQRLAASFVEERCCQSNESKRGISLLNITGKFFAHVILNRLKVHPEQGLLPERQYSFHRHRGTTDKIATARQLQEKCQEMLIHFFSTFVDLSKAFDAVKREGIWRIRQKFTSPERFTHMVRHLHDCMIEHVTDNGAISEAFAETPRAKHGCFLALKFFINIFPVMLMDAYRAKRLSTFAYRSHVSKNTVHELLFADDRREHVNEHVPLRHRLRQLRTNQKRKENGGDAPATAQHSQQSFTVNGTQRQAVDAFSYLSRTFIRSANIDDFVTHRISRAS
ncbi:unnamed protein product [Schistocephalus solidus]|uniref:Reverse transcriptase domain-containing protein n=1 Tax=Schistocephalus solidus TaxID=70667 RepID=A0A183T3F9_SCHSO|nr:unnamed protein product [Schistocephalus solidus]